MVLAVSDICTFSHEKRVHTIVLAVGMSVIVDPAACDYHDVRSVCNVEVIVYLVCKACRIEDYRDMDFLSVRIAVDVDVDPRLVLLFHDLYVLAVPMT